MKYLSFLAIVMVSVSCTSPDKTHYRTASDFVLLDEVSSPNEKYIYFEYQFDNGAFGYSRVFWALVNKDEENSDLSESLIPDGYKIMGWSNDNELLLQEWEPYYYKSNEIELTDGMELFGVKIKLMGTE